MADGKRGRQSMVQKAGTAGRLLELAIVAFLVFMMPWHAWAADALRINTRRQSLAKPALNLKMEDATLQAQPVMSRITLKHGGEGVRLLGALGSDSETWIYFSNSKDPTPYRMRSKDGVAPSSEPEKILLNPAGEPVCFSPFKDLRPGIAKTEQYKAAVLPKGKRAVALYASADGKEWKLLSEASIPGMPSLPERLGAACDAARNTLAIFGVFKGKPLYSESKDGAAWSPLSGISPSPGKNPIASISAGTLFGDPETMLVLFASLAAEGKTPSLAFMLSAGDAGFRAPGTTPVFPPGFEGTASAITISAPLRYPDGSPGIYAGTGGSIHAYRIKAPGWISVHAGPEKGVVTVGPVVFEDANRLTLDFSTSATGTVSVELRDAENIMIAGAEKSDSPVLTGNRRSFPVHWRSGFDVGSLAGKAVLVRFYLKDARLFAFRFVKEKSK